MTQTSTRTFAAIELSVGDLLITDAGTVRVVDAQAIFGRHQVALVVSAQGRERRVRMGYRTDVTIYAL